MVGVALTEGAALDVLGVVLVVCFGAIPLMAVSILRLESISLGGEQAAREAPSAMMAHDVVIERRKILDMGDPFARKFKISYPKCYAFDMNF